MSLFVINLPWLSWGPKIKLINGQVYSRSNFFISALILFVYFKQVRIDPKEDLIIKKKRFLWFLTHTTKIEFSRIRSIRYDFSEIATSWNAFFNVEDTMEFFKVYVVLHDDKWIKLWTFPGEGSAETGLWGVLQGDSMVDYEGTSAEDSRYFVELLQHFTGKPLK